MPKTKISEFSATPGNNTDIDGINIAEGCAPSGINDAIRELMAQLKDFQAGTAGDSFNGPVGTSTAAAGAFTTLSSTGNTTLGDASGDAVTINGATTFVNVSPTITPGTANGVAYLNGSKVLTTGSALTFDGTRLTSITGKFGGGAASNSASLMVNNATNTATGIQLFQDGIESWIMGMPANSAGLAWSASGSEQMRLTSTGLGIGTSSPGFALDIAKAKAVLRVQSTTATNAAYMLTSNSGGDFYMGRENSAGTEFGTTAYSSVLWSANAYPMAFFTNGIERMRLDSAGNLGIGTSSPAYKLDVNGAARVNNLLWFTPSSGLMAIGASGTNFQIYNGAGAETRLTIDSSGNLGLGVTPSAWGANWKAIQVNGLYGGALSTSSSSNTSTNLSHSAYHNGTNWIYGYTGVGAARYEIDGPAGGATHKWYTAPSGTAGNAISFTQAMTLTAGGDLGVGTTSPDIFGRFYTRSIGFSSSGTTGLQVNGSTYGTVDVGAGGTRTGNFVGSSTEVQLGTVTSIPLLLVTNGTERARITSGGYFKASNAGTYEGSTSAYHELRTSQDDEFVARITNTASPSPYGVLIRFTAAAPNDATKLFLNCTDNASGSTQRAAIRSNGGLANYSANDVNLSDRREKTNLAPAKSYLDTICAIPVQTFNYINQSEDDPGLTLGVVAQDVQAVAPELVMESNWGTEDNPKMRLSIYQTDLQYALMKALQELKAEFDAYKATHP